MRKVRIVHQGEVTRPIQNKLQLATAVPTTEYTTAAVQMMTLDKAEAVASAWTPILDSVGTWEQTVAELKVDLCKELPFFG